jgi:ABC-type phosphate transport system auxiliary subunit
MADLRQQTDEYKAGINSFIGLSCDYNMIPTHAQNAERTRLKNEIATDLHLRIQAKLDREIQQICGNDQEAHAQQQRLLIQDKFRTLQHTMDEKCLSFNDMQHTLDTKWISFQQDTSQ